MSYVFLSYDRDDLARITKLHAALTAAGLEVWWDEDTPLGTPWRDHIPEKVKAAPCVIVCWSKHSVNSRYVRAEAEIAHNLGTLIPLKIDGVDPPFGFNESQSLDLTTWSEDALARLIREAKQKLKATPQPAPFATRPIVLISSTIDDLIPYREQVRSAAHALGFATTLSDAAAGETAQPGIAAADLVFLIVAHRYGHLIRQEYLSARQLRKPLIVFVADSTHPWPTEFKEEHRTLEALTSPVPANVIEEVKSSIARLAEFKAQLDPARTVPFTDPFSLRAAAGKALQEWVEYHPQSPIRGAADHELYLKYLEDETRQIRIRGLKSKRAEPYFFGIDEIYIPLTTIIAGERGLDPQQRRTTLEHALSQRKLVIVGEPGAGKSTFLRRVAFELCRSLRETRPPDAVPFLAPDDCRFPILIRIGDLAKLLANDKSAKPADSPDWIPYFLDKQSQEFKWRLNYKFFERKLAAEGGCLVLIDGLDEAPDRRLRQRISRIFEKATAAFHKCDFLVTTRPQSYEGDSVLAGFHTLRVSELQTQEILGFLEHFALALALTEAESAKFHQEVGEALSLRPEIREMAANPVMLTALAVLQHNDQRLPEHRVQLYESIVEWLAAAREQKDGRPNAKQCLERMRRLALHMQDGPSGRVVQINRRKAAEFLDGQFGGGIEHHDEILEQETEDSGIISSVGSDIKFWHLSFQEYLAAREITSLSEADQSKRVLADGRLYHSEWRETMRLLGALLRLQGEAKIEGFVRTILATLGPNATLPEKAPCVALLGAMMRDLERMGYQPKTPGYEQTVKAVMTIFEPGESQQIDPRTRIEAADALGQVGDPRLEENNWVTIPAGTFWMGAQKVKKRGQNYDPEVDDDGAPVHEVSLRAFRIRRFPVTVHEYAKFIDNKGYANKKHWLAGGFGEFGEPEDWERQREYPSRPVVGVCWFEAAAYCAYSGGRLPTEAEWERAARGPNSCRYPWGNGPPLSPDRANSSEIAHPTAVGLFPLGNSHEGLSDLLGNVFEWTADWFDDSYYSVSPPANPIGPTEGQRKVMRGGSWGVNPLNVRVSVRARYEPSNRNHFVGFRCAGELP